MWWGGYAFAALAALAAAIMCWEWHKMALGGFGWSGRAAALLCAGACLLAVSTPLAALVLVLAAAFVGAGLATDLGRGNVRARAWVWFGALYVGVPAVALVWLRGQGAFGRTTLLWLLLVVWATDIGAYACGRLIGGPLLAPKVSPKKTWAGLLGGMASAALVGLAAGWEGATTAGFSLAVGSAVLAMVAQGGDLLESWVKRRWGVKDASNIIPGHGGVLDRVDGLLTAAGAVALGVLATGTEVLKWQW